MSTSLFRILKKMKNSADRNFKTVYIGKAVLK